MEKHIEQVNNVSFYLVIGFLGLLVSGLYSTKLQATAIIMGEEDPVITAHAAWYTQPWVFALVALMLILIIARADKTLKPGRAA